VLGPLFVWLAYREQPTEATLAGGAVIMAAVVVQALGDLRKRGREALPVAVD
jgi:drug/metabolite transporter (DMT)-like permease